jgi:glycerate dehydrogenase/D-3-phosphoglycerate dehydrogenase
MAQVLVTPRPFFQKGRRWLDELERAGHKVVVNDLGRRFTRDELSSALAAADALITGNDPLDADMLACTSHLKVIAKYGVGLDNIDVAYCEARGIVVRKALGANSVSVSEAAVMLMLCALRRLSQLAAAAKAGRDMRLMGREAEGKTLGLVGVGAIGSLVARVARALDMEVVGCDPALTPETAPEGVWLTSQDELLALSDVVSLHLPLASSTRGIVDKGFLASMRVGSVLVNTSRGGLVDAEALYGALTEGHLAFAAEDVELKERPGRLVALDNYLVTPHAASFTEEADEKTMAACVRNVRAVIG